MTEFGIYVGTDPQELAQFEDWLGRDVDFVRAHGDRRTWDNYVDSLNWVGDRFDDTGDDIYWSVPMFAESGTLSQAAGGAYNSYWVDAAKAILSHSPASGPVYVRVGEEFNGDWMPWAAKGQEQTFVEAFREFVDVFRSVSDRFVFEWNVNIGDFGVDPAKCYPGDAYVDVIGMDFYYDLRWDSSDPVQAFNTMVNEKYGLQWLESFAAAHNKPTAYSEWGIGTDNAEEYVALVEKWFDSHNVLYQSYYNSNGGFPAKLYQYPATAEAFREIYSQPDDGTTSEPPVVDEPPVQEDPITTDPSTNDNGAITADSVVVELWNAETDQKVAVIQPGVTLDPSLLGMDNLTVVVTPLDGGLGSVTLDFQNGLYQRTESIVPYALFGDWQGDLHDPGAPLFTEAGTYNLALGFFDASGGGGTSLGTLDYQINVASSGDSEPDPVPEPEPEVPAQTGVEGFTFELWNSHTDRKIVDLTSGMALDPAAFVWGQTTIVVAPTPGGIADGDVGSIRFIVDDVAMKTENVAPYATFGDRGGNLWGGLKFGEGTHEIEIEVYEGKNGNGELLGKYAIPITVTESGAYVEQISTDVSNFDLDLI